MKYLIIILFFLSLLWSCTTSQSTSASSQIHSFCCVGTEPFWGVKIKGNEITYESIDEQILEYEMSSFSSKDDGQYSFKGDNSTNGAIEVIIVKEACSDGMSDIEYAYSCRIIRKNEELKGCAKKNN